MHQKVSEQIAECLRRAAEADERAHQATDPTLKTDYGRMAQSWRTLARSYEFQSSLGRFISFNNDRQQWASPILAEDHQSSSSASVFEEKEADILDRLARVTGRIPPYSVDAVAIALASVSIATLVRFGGGWAPTDLHFAIYLPAILATGLLAGTPAAIGAALASLLIIFWAFMPPYFQFKWLTPTQQVNVFINAVPYFITVYFAYCCRLVLQRLHRRERTNEILAGELRHRARNLFSVIQAIVQRTLAETPDRAEKLTGRLRSILYANELLVSGKSDPITVRDLLLQEFAPYGENRLQMRGLDLEIEPENARHLLLLFHELVTNAAKYGSLSHVDGNVIVEWRWNNSRRLAMTWTEIGGPTVAPPSSDGFGSQLMRLCVKSLHGTMQAQYLPEGFACGISVRIDRRH